MPSVTFMHLLFLCFLAKLNEEEQKKSLENSDVSKSNETCWIKTKKNTEQNKIKGGSNYLLSEGYGEVHKEERA